MHMHLSFLHVKYYVFCLTFPATYTFLPSNNLISSLERKRVPKIAPICTLVHSLSVFCREKNANTRAHTEVKAFCVFAYFHHSTDAFQKIHEHTLDRWGKLVQFHKTLTILWKQYAIEIIANILIYFKLANSKQKNYRMESRVFFYWFSLGENIYNRFCRCGYYRLYYPLSTPGRKTYMKMYAISDFPLFCTPKKWCKWREKMNYIQFRAYSIPTKLSTLFVFLFYVLSQFWRQTGQWKPEKYYCRLPFIVIPFLAKSTYDRYYGRNGFLFLF